MEVVGPYAFRRYTDRLQTEWSDSDSGQVLEYIEWKHWHTAPAGTPTRDPSDIIVNLNPGYFGALANAGGELKLSIAMISGVILDVFHGVSDVAVPATRLAYAITLMAAQVQSILADPRINGNVTLFHNLWATSLSPPWNFTNEWDLILPAQEAGKSLPLSQRTISQLWNANVLGSISNPSPDSVLALQRASSSEGYFIEWADAFAMDYGSAAIILQRWLPHYMCGKSDPLLCARTGASSYCGCSPDQNPECGYIAANWKLPCNSGIGALAWQQFVQGTLSEMVWKQPSMISVFPSAFPGPEIDAPELAGFMQQRYYSLLSFAPRVIV